MPVKSTGEFVPVTSTGEFLPVKSTGEWLQLIFYFMNNTDQIEEDMSSNSHIYEKCIQQGVKKIKMAKRRIVTCIYSHSAGTPLLKFFRLSKCFDLWREVPFMCLNFVTRPNLNNNIIRGND